DVRRVYASDRAVWGVAHDIEASGNPWAAVSTNGSLRFTTGEGMNDDRCLRSFVPDTGFSERERIACPEFTGSYLSYDGGNIYLSQWYKHRLLKLDAKSNILRTFDLGAEISGHTFVEIGRASLGKEGSSRW